ncbi:helix-turn-helix domain-containing protein [Enterococcus sp. LJL98]
MNKRLLKLYESEAVKTLVILSFLARSESFVSMKELCDKSELSIASVYKYLAIIVEEIVALDEVGMGLSVTEEGVQFYAQNMQQYYRLRNHFIHSSLSIELGMALLLGEKIQREPFIQKKYISAATFKRRMRSLKHLFLEYHLNIQFRKGVFLLKGDEAQIRKLAYEVLHDLYREGSWPFATIDEAFVTSKVEAYLGLKETATNEGLFRQLKLEYGIMISRLRNQGDFKITPLRLEASLEQAMLRLIPNEGARVPEVPTVHALYFVMALLSREAFYQTPRGEAWLLSFEQEPSNMTCLVSQAQASFCQTFALGQESEGIRAYLYSIHFEKYFYRYWCGAMHKKNIATPYPILNRRMIQYVLTLRKSAPEYMLGPLYFLIRKYVVLYGRYHYFSHYELPIVVYLEDDDFPSQGELIANMCREMFLYKYKLVFGTYEEADVLLHTTTAFPPPRLSHQIAEEIPTYYLNLANPYRRFSELDQIFQNIADQKILAYNQQLFGEE